MDIFEFARSFEFWVPLATIVNLVGLLVIGFLAFRRADVREHHRWLQEKRREAYVEFLAATRKASGTIATFSQDAEKKRRRRRIHQSEREAAIGRDEDEANYAQDVLAIVGPSHMADQGRQVLARLKLDRLFYSPTREQQLRDGKEKYIQRAKETGDHAFATGFARLYDSKTFDVAAYEELHADHPLRGFWAEFASKAEEEMRKAHPGRWPWSRRC